MTFQHRAGVRPYTSSCELAESCVFSKQSSPPLHCDSRRLREQVPTPTGAHLLPKLRCDFAEFLNQGSLKRLRILSSPTRVGLRYGHQTDSLRGFSWKHGIGQFIPAYARSSSRLGVKTPRICLWDPPTRLNRDIHHPDDLPFSVPPSLKHPSGGTGILTCFPSTTPFGLALGTD